MIAALRRHPVLSAGAVAVLACLPGLVAVVKVIGHRWYPAGDMAQAELHVRGLWSHPPLVGAAGRIDAFGVQGSHPGPAAWVALWPVYALGGSTSAALVVSVFAVQLAACWVLLWCALRAGRLFAALVTLGVVAMFRASGPVLFVEPWNPWFSVLPFAVCLVAAWFVAGGLGPGRGPRWIPLMVGAGTVAVQGHVGYLLVVVAACATALVVGALAAFMAHPAAVGAAPGQRGTPTAPTEAGTAGWRRVLSGAGRVTRRVTRRDAWAEVIRWVCVGALVGLVMWLPPLLDQLRRSPGNLAILVEHFSHPTEALIAPRAAARIVASELSVLGPWLTGPMLTSRWPALALVTIGLWSTAVVVAWRRGDRRLLALHAVLGVTTLAGAMSVLRIFGGFQEYTVRWWWVLTPMILVASVCTLVRHRPQHSVARRAVVGVALAGTVLLAGLASVQAGERAKLSGLPDSRVIGALMPELVPRLDRSKTYFLRWWDPVSLDSQGVGLQLELERRGIRTLVDPHWRAAVLPHRTGTEANTDAVLWLVLGPAIERFRAAGFTELAAANVWSPAEQARFTELDTRLRARLAEIGRADLAGALDQPYGSAQMIFMQPPLPADIGAALGEYVALRLPAAVFQLPVDAVPPTP